MSGIEVTDENFSHEVIEKSEKVPVVVDFWAPLCRNCRIVSPRLKFLSKEYNRKFVLAKMNVDQNPATSQKYDILGIPTVKMFKNGNPVAEFSGAIPESKMRDWLNNNL